MKHDFERGVVGAGGEVVGRLFTHDLATEFSQIVSAVGRLRPDAVFVGGGDTLAGPLLRQLRAAGVRTRMFGGDGICTWDLPRHAGGTLAPGDVVCAEAGGVMPGQAQAMREFQARFRARFKEEVVAFAPYSYDAVYVIADAMRRAGSTSRDAVAKALPAADMAGVTGRIRFDARGDIVNGAFTIHTYAGQRRERLGVFLAE
jgi:branched-chain amino acid transport system substrate-binding protein